MRSSAPSRSPRSKAEGDHQDRAPPQGTTARETLAASETTTETSDSTKDSSEIVNEAASTFEWNQDLDVSASFLGIGVDSTFGENNEDRSKATSSRLSETMQKTAAKIRRETKVVVSTKTEESFDREESSEISNPNNEIAVTYEYYKLQQQYEVTYLAEVESVIFVAEHLPPPSEVNSDWVRRHDGIIAKVLKDESYRATLNALIQEVDEEDDPLTGTSNPTIFEDVLLEAKTKFATFANTGGGPGQGGLSVPDIYAAPQRSYQEQLREKAARVRANRVRAVQRQRLFQHIIDNILHYCRAIWAAEDSDQRILRYKKENRRIPVEWTGPAPQLQPVGAPPAAAARYAPTGRTAPVWELVDPTGPLGYTGNYAVFALRPLPVEGSADAIATLTDALSSGSVVLALNDVLSDQRAGYVDPTGPLHRTLLDPALKAFREEAAAIALRTPEVLARSLDEVVLDIVWYLPRLKKGAMALLRGNGSVARGANGDLTNPIRVNDYGEYLYRRHGTRQFLVDSNNLYLGIRTSEGAAMEPFKRAHRYLDVLRAKEEVDGAQLKNRRREAHLNQAGEYDPDVQKVVIVGDGSFAATSAAVHAGLPGVGGSSTAGSATGPSGSPPDPIVP